MSTSNNKTASATWLEAIMRDPENSAVYQSEDQAFGIAIQSSVTGFELMYVQHRHAMSVAEVEALLEEWKLPTSAKWLSTSEVND